MNAFRFSLPFVALLGVFLLYWMLYQAIIISSTKKLENNSYGNISFTRILKEDEVDKKERLKKELPKPKPIKTPPKISRDVPKNEVKIQDQKLDIDIPLAKLPINIDHSNFLNGAVLNQGFSRDTQAVPMLRIPPVYPRRAKMLKKEGFVKLKLFISSSGVVQKAEVIEAKPKNIFDKAALQSVYGWKFKPRYIDGKAVEQVATQVLEFKLRN